MLSAAPTPIHSPYTAIHTQIPPTQAAPKPRTSTPQLLQHAGALEHRGLALLVGLDTADVVGLHRVQLDHQLCELLFELRAHGVEFERLERLAALGTSGVSACGVAVVVGLGNWTR